MKIRFVTTLILLAAMTSVQCLRPNPPSAAGQQANRNTSGNRQASNANTKRETFLDFATKCVKNNSTLRSTKVKELLTKDVRFDRQDAEGARFVRQDGVRNDDCTRSVRIKTNHPDGIFVEGDLLVLELVSNLDGYPYIVNRHPDGHFTVLYPSEKDDHQPVKAGETVFFPGKGDYEIVTKAPFGVEKIIAIVSKQKLDLKQLESPEFYAKRGLLKGDSVTKFERVEISADDFPCQTITVTSYPKGQRPASQPKKRFVLLIGPTVYQWETYPPLPACLNDVLLLAKIFAEYGRIDVMGVLSGEDVTMKNVRKAFDALIEQSRPGDEIFIVWTGHGGERPDTTGTQPTKKTGYLVLYDSKLNDPESVLTDVEFEHWLDDLDGRKIAIFIDACLAGGMIDANIKSGKAEGFNIFADKFAKHQARDGVKDIRPDQAAVLCSSQVDEKSVVRTDIPFSAMLWSVAEYVYENDKSVSFGDLCKYAEENVPKVVREQHQGRKQTPVYMNQIGTIFVKP